MNAPMNMGGAPQGAPTALNAQGLCAAINAGKSEAWMVGPIGGPWYTLFTRIDGRWHEVGVDVGNCDVFAATRAINRFMRRSFPAWNVDASPVLFV